MSTILSFPTHDFTYARYLALKGVAPKFAHVIMTAIF